MQALGGFAGLELHEHRHVEVVPGAVGQEYTVAETHDHRVQRQFAAGFRLGDQVVDAFGPVACEIGTAQLDGVDVGVEVGVESSDGLGIGQLADNGVAVFVEALSDGVRACMAFELG